MLYDMLGSIFLAIGYVYLIPFLVQVLFVVIVWRYKVKGEYDLMIPVIPSDDLIVSTTKPLCSVFGIFGITQRVLDYKK